MNYKSSIKLFCISALTMICAFTASAQSTAFTYQGKLNVSNNPATGSFEMRFTLEDVDGFQIGNPVTPPNVAVMQGIFTVQLDFGANFDTFDRYLKIEVRQSGQNP